jgi:hypothetical protein
MGTFSPVPCCLSTWSDGVLVAAFGPEGVEGRRANAESNPLWGIKATTAGTNLRIRIWGTLENERIPKLAVSNDMSRAFVTIMIRHVSAQQLT